MNGNANVMETAGTAIPAADEVVRARAKPRRTLEAAKASLHNGTERVRTRARHAAGSTDEYVHSNPWSAIGIAAAAGATIAVLLSARMHR